MYLGGCTTPCFRDTIYWTIEKYCRCPGIPTGRIGKLGKSPRGHAAVMEESCFMKPLCKNGKESTMLTPESEDLPTVSDSVRSFRLQQRLHFFCEG